MESAAGGDRPASDEEGANALRSGHQLRQTQRINAVRHGDPPRVRGAAGSSLTLTSRAGDDEDATKGKQRAPVGQHRIGARRPPRAIVLEARSVGLGQRIEEPRAAVARTSDTGRDSSS